MYRKFSESLIQWDKNANRKPLMIIGARQTGKTWIVQEFLRKQYKDYIYINLEKDKEIRTIFDGDLDPDRILTQMGQLLGRSVKYDVPIFIDEIQTSENAVTSLKYFCEDKRDFHVITAGSLLGVKIRRFKSSFPVGKVQIEQFYPMDFEEFLVACNEKELEKGIKESFENMRAMPEGIHNKALRLYHDYLLTGGMPEVVQNYIDSGRDMNAIDGSIRENLELAYMADMTKYVTSPQESVKITEVYHSIPRQLAKENPKFKYSEVKKGANRRDFYGPVDWLEASGMIYKINKVISPLSPLKGYEDDNSFKIYLSDVGLLASSGGIRARDLLPDVHNTYKGAVIENYVVQQLKENYKELYYYKPSDSMEIDLLLDTGDGVIPVEIKSGRHKSSKSLNNFREKYHPPYSIRLSENNFGYADGLYSIPLYAANCIQDLWGLALARVVNYRPKH